MNQQLALRTAALLTLACMTGSGCRTTSPDTDTPATLTSTHSPAEAYTAAVSVLQGMHFKIDKANSDTGFIQTRALRGAQWFELWRRDNAGSKALAEANLHSLRRTVTVHIREESNRTLIHCHVLSERLSVPSRPITSSSQLYRLLTNSENMMQRLEFTEKQERSMEWIDTGGDPGLEQRILAGIERGLPGASSEAPAT